MLGITESLFEHWESILAFGANLGIYWITYGFRHLGFDYIPFAFVNQFWPLCIDHRPSEVNLGPLEVVFWSQDVDVGHLVFDFETLTVNFRPWGLILSPRERFLFL